MTVTIKKETVTPEKAVEWLGAQHLNRSIRTTLVKRYGQAMKVGEWVDNAEPIRFNSDGTLIDGQHRLSALRDQELTLDLWVARGLTHEAQATIDTGSKRTVGDVMTMRGIPNAHTMAAALNVLHKHLIGEDGNRAGYVSVTAPRALELYAEHQAIQESLTYAKRVYVNRPALAPGYAVALHYIFSLIDGDDANEFFDRLADGADLKKGSPILALRNLLERLEKDSQRAGHRAAKAYVQAVTVKAWNAWRAGNTYMSNTRAPLKWIRVGKRAEPFPQPE